MAGAGGGGRVTAAAPRAAVGFRRTRLTDPDAPRALADLRSYLGLERQWTRMRALIRALDRGGDLAQAALALAIPHEAVLATLPPDLARQTLEDRCRRLRTEIDARVDVSPALSAHQAVTRLGLTHAERAVVGALITIECDAAVMRALTAGGPDRLSYPVLAALDEILGGVTDLPRLAQQLLGHAHGGTAFCEFTDGEAAVGTLAQPLCNAGVRLRPRLRDFLLELETVPASLAGLIQVPARPGSALVVAGVRDLVAAAVGSLRAGMVPWLIGPPGAGRRTAAALIGEVLAQPVWVIAWSELAHDGYRAELRLRDLELESHLARPVIMLDWRGPWAPSGLPILARLVRTLRSPLVISSDEPIAGLPAIAERAVTHRFELPSAPARARLIAALLAERGHPPADDATVDDLAAAFALHPGELRAILAMCPSDRGGAALVASYREQAFAHVHGRLAELAQPIRNRFTWADLVVDDESRAELTAIIDAVRYRRVLFEDWGLARLLPYGRGVHAIFSGPPGTGKTMAASVVAATMGRELFRVDVSQLVSKYIGETEKNIGRIFDAAAGTHAVLFFDEADALFARRTEVRSHHDRSANMETGYLLQRMEHHDGVTILATNLIGSIDSAFGRRIPYRVEFVRPGVAERTAMWRHLLQPPLPTRAVDPVRLAGGFELSGAQIKNAVVRAGLRAAAAARIIDQPDLEWAALIERRIAGAVLAAPPAELAPTLAVDGEAADDPDDDPGATAATGPRAIALSPDGAIAAIRTDDALALHETSGAGPVTEVGGDGLIDFGFVGCVLWIIDRSGLRRIPIVGSRVGKPLASPWPVGAGRLLSPGLAGRGDLAAWAAAAVALARVHNDGRVTLTGLPGVHGDALAVTGDGRVLMIQADALVVVSPSGIAARMPLAATAPPLAAAAIQAGGFAVVMATARGSQVQTWDRGGQPVRVVPLPPARAAAIGAVGGLAVIATTGDELIQVDLRSGGVVSRAPAEMRVQQVVTSARGDTVLAVGRANGQPVRRLFGAATPDPG